MKLHEILQVMADNAKPDSNGNAYKEGHIMHNLLLDNKPIRTVDASELEHMMYSPERFSLAPRTHVVNGFTVPAPETEAPQDEYFIANIGAVEFHQSSYWANHDLDSRRLKRGLIHLTKDYAIANAKAMLGINPYSEGE